MVKGKPSGIARRMISALAECVFLRCTSLSDMEVTPSGCPFLEGSLTLLEAQMDVSVWLDGVKGKGIGGGHSSENVAGAQT